MTTQILHRSAPSNRVIGNFAVILVIGLCLAAGSVVGQTALTIDDVHRLALQHNRTLLSAEQEVEKAGADVKRAWADALPNVRLNAGYNRSFYVPRTFFTTYDSLNNPNTMELQLGFKNSYNAQISASQSLWHGGKVLTALQVAKLYKAYSKAVENQVEAEVVYAANQLFFAAILARSQLDVLNSALASNNANLDVVTKMESQGMASEYEVLRATVERDNLLPQVVAAESNLRLSEKRLKSFLGLDLGEPVTLVDNPDDTVVTSLRQIPSLIDTALALRPEAVQAQSLEEIAQKGVKIAKADRWPSLDAVAAYDWSASSDDFTMKKNNSRSWTAGLVLNFNIFDGGRTGGNIREREAQLAQARLAKAQTTDDITLEVEAAWDALKQAQKALEVQKATIASAEEGLRIARLRFETGVGTQLEVLSAQTALTDARSLQAQALYNFRVARAGLEKATTLSIDTDQ